MFDAEVTREPAVGAVPAEAEPAGPVAPAAAEAALAETRWSRFVRRGPIAFATVGAIGAICRAGRRRTDLQAQFHFTLSTADHCREADQRRRRQAAVIAARVHRPADRRHGRIDDSRVVAPDAGALFAKLPPAARRGAGLRADRRTSQRRACVGPAGAPDQVRHARGGVDRLDFRQNVNDVDEQLQQLRFVWPATWSSAGGAHQRIARTRLAAAATRGGGKVVVNRRLPYPDQSDEQGAICRRADHAAEGDRRRSRQCRSRRRAGGAPNARHPDGLVQPGRRARGRSAGRRDTGTRAADEAQFHRGARSLLPLPQRDHRFVESLVTCTKVLSFDPWNGAALYLVGLGQLHLGRFEDALATFRQADRFDAQAESALDMVARRQGSGERHDGPRRRRIAMVAAIDRHHAASGRSHMLMAAAYQQLGRIDEARAAVTEGLKLRPGTTALNVAAADQECQARFLSRLPNGLSCSSFLWPGCPKAKPSGSWLNHMKALKHSA